MGLYEELFVNPSEEAAKWDNKFIELASRGKTKELLEFIRATGAKELYIEDYKISASINEFTKKNNSDAKKQEIIKALKKLNGYVEDAVIAENKKFNLPEALITTTEGQISAIPFSKFLPVLIGKYPDIETQERQGKCFVMSYEISGNLGVPNQLVTGYTYGYSDKAQYLHSWIETTLNGEEVVIDYTLNAIINRAGYYLIRHAKALSRIADVDVRKDAEILSKCEQGEKTFSLEEYLVFRDEIIKDLQSKNGAEER